MTVFAANGFRMFFSPKAASNASSAADEFGALPEWALDDLYPGMESLEFEADFARAETLAKAFVERYRGHLDALARGADASAN